jgi:hypothetical protein
LNLNVTTTLPDGTYFRLEDICGPGPRGFLPLQLKLEFCNSANPDKLAYSGKSFLLRVCINELSNYVLLKVNTSGYGVTQGGLTFGGKQHIWPK